MQKIKKIFINIILFIAVYRVMSLVEVEKFETLMTAIFTVSSILFSVALSIIASINLLVIKNIEVYKKLSITLKGKRNAINSWFSVIIISFAIFFLKLFYTINVYNIELILDIQKISLSLCFMLTFKLALQFQNIQKFKSELDDIVQNDINKS